MKAILRKARRVRQLTKAFGPSWLMRRAGYSVQMRLGVLERRTPASDWAAVSLQSFLRDPALAAPQKYADYRRSQAPPFFFSPADRARYAPLFAQWDEGETPMAVAAEILEGSLRYFEHTPGQIGFPPNWNHNPFTGNQAPAGRHWSRIGDFGCGDIKVLWEPSRFGSAYTLVRAYWRTGGEQYPELFWKMVEDWGVHNPPQQGVNWKCGQETSLRVMAWCFGLYGFLDSPATTPERLAMLGQMIAVSGRRIAANLSYALGQRNNHGISEGAGLWTIGTLFPELSSAAKWRETGQRVLESEARDLIYDDGSFSQHSMNYHRLMQHDYLWCLRLAEIQGKPFSAELKARVEKAGRFLYEVQDDVSGGVPCYGANDGALILPLNNCDYANFRPVTGASLYGETGKRSYEPGPWDEDLLWLYGPDASEAPVSPPPRTDFKAADGGYYTLRGDDGFAFIRCASFRHRPGQADLLHADIWWRGQNVALDAGTFSYNPTGPQTYPFECTEYHNTVGVDGLDQMERASRFLWLPWARGKVRADKSSTACHLVYWEGEHDGYARLKPSVMHRRGLLRLGGEHWLVVDALASTGPHRYRLHWLLPDVPFQWDEENRKLSLATPAGAYAVQTNVTKGAATASVVRADENSARGWRSPYYGDREAAVSLDLRVEDSNAYFWTVLGPEGYRVEANAGELHIATGNWRAAVRLNFGREGALLASVGLEGDLQDTLVIS